MVEVLVRNAGKLVAQRQLLQEVWGPEYGTETNYLRVHMAHIRQKLEPEPSRPRYFLTEPGMGYRFEADAILGLVATASRRLLPHRDVLGAVTGERRARPGAPALAQRHAGQPRHQVQLGRPDVAKRLRELAERTVAEPVVVRDRGPGSRCRTRRSRAAPESPRTAAPSRPAGAVGAAGRRPRSRSNRRAPGARPRSGSTAPVHLAWSGSRSCCRRGTRAGTTRRPSSWRCRRSSLRSSSAPGFACSSATIAGDRSIPCTRTPRALQRQRDATGTDRELERGAVARQIREEAHRRLEHGRVEHLRGGRVVVGRDPFVEVDLGHGAL